MTDQKLAGQTVWISGGASGIGEATAELFAEEGACVAVVDVQAARGRDVVERIAKSGGTAVFFDCDVASDSQVRESINGTAQRFGGLQIIVNCAGFTDVGLLHEYPEEQWDRLMGVNLKSIYLSIKHGMAHLRENKRSYVVNVGSISSFVGQARTPAYTASKHAVLGLSRSIALDYAADGVRCNCVCPGITDTPLLRYHLRTTGDAEETLRKRLRRVPMGVRVMPRDVAQSVLYFSCEDSAGITGTSLVVDCGYLSAAEWETYGPTAFEDDA
jgi:NAD(P)-dependent dehydrogenase (short-subunit alcohol dehydrogenase family)